MPDATLDLAGLLQTLDAHRVRFVLIGGLAMVAHGSAHVTEDIDIVYSRDANNLAALARALAPYHPALRGITDDLPFELDERSLRWSLNLTLRTDLGSIDRLAELPGMPPFERLWDRAPVMNLYGISVRVASLDDLIVMKRSAGRQKDLIHLPELEALQRLAREPAD